MDIGFNVPINPVSFGNVSFNLIREVYKNKEKYNLSFFPIGDVDVSTFNVDADFNKWLAEANAKAVQYFRRSIPTVRLWHLVTADYDHLGNLKKVNPCIDSVSDKQTFISFYELDSPSQVELNVAKNFDTVFTSQYTCDVFADKGVKTRYIPLGFDKSSFKVTNKKYFSDDRISFCILGKFENRKHHVKMIRAWVKRFGNDRRYYLQCAVYNPFFKAHENENLFRGSLEGKHVGNVNFLQFIPTNAMYNDFLNSNHIVLAMSGGEGWGLPEFHTVGLGKHAVVLNAHGYKGWADAENSVLISPLNKISSVDGVFFKQGLPYNQGSIFDWDEEEFIAGCEEAIKRYQTSPVNRAGLKLQDRFTYEKSLEMLINNR